MDTAAPSTAAPFFDARAWVIWLLVTAGLVFTMRNPWYTLIVFAIILLVADTHALPSSHIPFPLWRVGVMVLLFTALFNMVFSHVGSHVLFRLPANWLWIGGAVTLESAVFGINQGLLLLTLLLLFITFNRIVPPTALIRWLPRALRDVGVVILIGITYIPETWRQLQRIQEAQAIRGHQVKGIRDWQPVILPLLIGGLERAMAIAETMVARGFGHITHVRQSWRVQLYLLAALMATLTGWVIAFWWGWPGWLLVGGGIFLLGLLLRRLGQLSPHTHYQAHAWQTHDTMMVSLVLVPLLVWLSPFTDPAALLYSPYPALAWPPFNPYVGMSLAALAAPIFWKKKTYTQA